MYIPYIVSMSSDSKKTDKFLINVAPTFEPEDSSVEFNTQFSQVPEEFVQKYRLRCLSNSNSGGNNNLLSASGGGNGSVGNISSPVAPNIAINAGDSMASITSSIDEKPTMGSRENIHSNANNVHASPSVSMATSSSLQRELKEARSEIDRLKLLLVRLLWRVRFLFILFLEKGIGLEKYSFSSIRRTASFSHFSCNFRFHDWIIILKGGFKSMEYCK